MTDLDPWSTDYFASRDRFVALARACGARTACHPVRATGAAGEPLFVDTASLVPTDTEHLIVLTSGVHGVEGFVGASVQARALQRMARDGVPARTGVALVHAVNPWGFAHLRRVDENNIDVNRNFIDRSRPLPGSPPRYAALDPLINPRGAPRAGDEAQFWLRASTLIARDRGITELAGAIAQGQHEFPQGLFYGGADVGESCRLLQDIVRELAADVPRITHLDLHSGLGPSAVATLIGNGNSGAPEGRAERLRAHYRRPVRLDDASDNAYDAQGTLARWYRRAFGDRRYLYLCVEIGTVNPLKVLSALRRENRAHHWTAPGSAPYVRTKRALLDVFAPPSPRWRRESVERGVQVLERSFDLPRDW